MRYPLQLICACALGVLPLMGCETAGTTGGSGGAGGSAGSGSMPECESAEDCDGSNECTANACAGGMCEYAPVEDGSACDEANECTAGTCAEGTCNSTPVADGAACGDNKGTCEQGSCHGACTEQGIHDAIAAGGGPYTFDCGDGMTVVTEAEIVIDNDVILDGESKLTVDGGGKHADEGDDHTVFSVTEGVTAELRGFTVTGGREEGNPKCQECAAGGIRNDGGSLTLRNSTVSGNTVDFGSGGIRNGAGTLTLTNSTVSGNTGSNGVGIFNLGGTVTLTNSTVSGNTLAGVGGGDFASGIWHFGRVMTLTNSTVSGNTGRPSILNDGDLLTLANSLVDGDCARTDSATTASNGYNIESPGDTCGLDPDGTDKVDVTEAQLNLGPLADNGGPTMTHKPGDGGFDDGSSLAINAIPGDACDLIEDQRGEPRPETGGTMCDVGAFEVQP